jgi:hypothetical protein
MLYVTSPELNRLRRYAPHALSGERPALGGMWPESTDINRTALRRLLCGE